MKASDWISILGILISSIIAIFLYLLGKKIDDKQRIEHLLLTQDSVQALLKEGPRDIELYNTKLYDKRHFEKNTRSRIWGYAYHRAGLYNYSFEYVEFVVEIVNWKNKNYYRVGLIPYNKIVKILPKGDGTTNKPIIFVIPKFLQLDKYSISYKKFVYYPVKGGPRTYPPLSYFFIKFSKDLFINTRYQLYYRWKKR